MPRTVDEIWADLCRAPADDPLRHELAGVLRAANDPWGELIELQLSLARLRRWDDRRSTLVKREAELLGPWLREPHAWRPRWRLGEARWALREDCPYRAGSVNPYALGSHHRLVRALPAAWSGQASWLCEHAEALAAVPMEELVTTLVCIGIGNPTCRTQQTESTRLAQESQRQQHLCATRSREYRGWSVQACRP